MIEVEKKFILSSKERNAVTKLGKFLKQLTFTDVYFDTPDWWLTLHDIWFRRRGDAFELKIPVAKSRQPMNPVRDKSPLATTAHFYYARISNGMNVYREITALPAIARELRLQSFKEDFAENLAANRLRPFCSIVSKRVYYRYSGFTIDVSETDFDYTICEIEKMVRSEKNIPRATEEILALAARLGLEVKPVYGKVIEYLRRYNLRHFRALRKAGVIA